jgi:Putative polyhydroxyalkanoic acid system protein (PHA_gran_rgn)
MSQPLVVTVSHRLGKEEAVRRLKSGLSSARTNFSHVLTVEQETWTGEHFDFRVRAIGQVVSGSIDVQEDRVVLQFVLPWLLAKVASAIQPLIRKEGTLMLEKK